MGETTAMLSYFVLLFIIYVYLPYTMFKFATELSVDLGRRRDLTQLEEIVSGFLPCLFLHGWALAFFWAAKQIGLVQEHVDIGILASIAGDNRTAIADYIYSADWEGTVFYIGALWFSALFNGFWFGRSVRDACRHDVSRGDLDALRHGLDPLRYRVVRRLIQIVKSFMRICRCLGDGTSWRAKGQLVAAEATTCWRTNGVSLHLRPAWWFWYRFFSEAIVPLFPWQERPPNMVAITRNEVSTWIYHGKFLRYDKTTDGRLEAIRLANVTQYEWHGDRNELVVVDHDIKVLYLQWSQIHDLRTLDGPFTFKPEVMIPLRRSLRKSDNQVIAPLVLLLMLAPVQRAYSQSRPCASSIEDCNVRPRGCAKQESPEAEFNEQSRDRFVRPGAKPIRLTFDHIEKLQRIIDKQRLPPGLGIRSRDRHFRCFALDVPTISPLHSRSKCVGESTFVEISGYIVGQPHAHRGDSANCRFQSTEYSNFRFNIAELPGDSEFDSVVAEMIPQGRSQQWTLLKLRRIAQERTRVRIRGKLFYDNKELVNNDPERPLANAPGRLSLWEIHPVTEVLVCTNEDGECDSNDEMYWETLAERE